MAKGVLKLGMSTGINRIRKMSLGLQVSTLLTYIIGITALKKSCSKKEGSNRKEEKKKRKGKYD